MNRTEGEVRLPSVAIGVPTYRRPEVLPRLLRELGEQADDLLGRTGRPAVAGSVRIVLADNDPDRSAETTVTELARSCAEGGPEVRYVSEPVPGIAAVRNRLLEDTADADVLLSIDDDERPRPGWARHLLETWNRTGAAFVAGRVVPEYTGEVDPWLLAGRFFVRRQLPTGTTVPFAAGGNMLLDLAQVRAAGVRYRDDFGLSGGEDTVFTKELHAAGRSIVWCNESEAVDVVPAERQTRRWVLIRALSHGNSTVLSDTVLAPSRRRRAVRAQAAVAGLVRLGGGAGRALGGFAGRAPVHQARGLRTACRGAGMLLGAAGWSYEEYGRDGRLARFRPGA
ncbi:glycosyltransferase family 2 protein [Kocuria oceani]|uniref:Glycosyltransferase family 2 protein n=1 Tax=Kocuria oceani TaxID=988827 RepID=A0ABV9TJ76_9MICC|nr:glycosyltransferase [Kocuria oceani]